MSTRRSLCSRHQWIKLKLMQLRKCHILKISKVFVVSLVMLVSIYRRFIKDFSKISRLPTNFLQKEVPFVFYDDCVEAFETLKKVLISAPIIQPPDWNLPFEIMCDASDYVVGVVLGQRVDKKLNVIHYASKILDSGQRNYATTEKEFLAVVFACDKFRSYMVDSKVIIHTDHAAIKYFMEKKDAKASSLGGFSCYKNLTCISLIKKELRTP